MIRFMLLAFAAAALTPTAACAQESWDINGGWTGAYFCNQGKTALHLSIQEGTAADQVVAVFTFGPLKDNSDIPKGAYRMRGTFDAKAKRLTLRGETWIDQPAGYVMVDVEGLMRGSGFYISGDVLGPGCTHFDVLRDADDRVG